MGLHQAVLHVDVQGIVRKALDIIGNQDVTIQNEAFRKTLTAGTGNNQADLIYHDRVTLGHGATQDYDLSGTLKDIFGDDAVFAKIKAVVVINRSDQLGTPTAAPVGVDGNLIVSLFGVSADVPVDVGDAVVWTCQKAGKAVTDATADTITITNDDGSDDASVDVIFIGTSA